MVLSPWDARSGIALFRRAAERAEIEDRKSLSTGSIKDITDYAESGVHERNIYRLSTHQRILLDFVQEGGEVAAGTLQEVNKEYAQNAMST